MRFSHIILENWRNFGHVDVSLQNRVFLVGQNASGKSNFLEAFRFLRDIVTSGGFEKSVSVRGGVSRIRNLAARSSPYIVVDVTLQEKEAALWRYRISFSQDNQRRPVLKEEKVWHDGKVILNRPNDEDGADEARLRHTYLEQVNANLEFRDIADFFASVHYYHLVPQLVRDPSRWTGRRGDPYGEDFLEQIAGTNKTTRNARLRRISTALKIAVPQLSELELRKDERGVPHLRGKYEHWRAQGAWQTEADFSDGTLRLMGLLWSLLAGSGPILLEEPELSLHSEIVRYIPQMMLRAQRGLRRAVRQVILSTHSGDLLRDEGIAADEVLLVIPSKEGGFIQIGAEIAEVKQQLEAGLTVAEVVIPRTRPANAAQLALSL